MYFDAKNGSLVPAKTDLFRPIRRAVWADGRRGLVALAFCLPILCFPLGLDAAQSYALQDFRDPGELSRVKVSFDATGQLFERDGANGAKKEQAPKKTPVRVAARLMYDEKRPSEAVSGPSKPSTDQPAARHYHQAQAQLRLGSRKNSSVLRSDRLTIVAEPKPGVLTLFSPQGALTRSELDLIDVPASSHFVYGLLPPGRVKVGESWQHDDDLFAPIARVQSVTSNTMESKLTAVQKGVARISLNGTLRGRGSGADTELQISGEYRYDFRQRRISWIQMLIREHRPTGHTMPGFEMKADLRMLIAPHKDSSPLSEVDWQSLLAFEAPAREMVVYTPEEGGYELFHDRRWHVTSDGADGTRLRFVDNGDLLAQCNISELTPLSAGKQVGLEQFQQDVRRAVGQRFGQFEQASQETDEQGCHVLRVAALGKVEEVVIRWVYYHISNKAGRRAAYVFTMEADLAERFAEADQTLVSSLQFTERKKAQRLDPTATAAPHAKPKGATTSASNRRTTRSAKTANRRRRTRHRPY